MQTKDCSAVIVVPKKPFVDWVNWANHVRSAPEKTKEYFLENCTILLIPRFLTKKESKKYLNAIWDEIFTAELARYVDEPLWLHNRSNEIFRKWFGLEFHSAVLTLLMKD